MGVLEQYCGDILVTVEVFPEAWFPHFLCPHFHGGSLAPPLTPPAANHSGLPGQEAGPAHLSSFSLFCLLLSWTLS